MSKERVIPVEKQDRVWSVMDLYAKRRFPENNVRLVPSWDPWKLPRLEMTCWNQGEADAITAAVEAWTDAHIQSILDAPEPFSAEAFVEEHGR